MHVPFGLANAPCLLRPVHPTRPFDAGVVYRRGRVRSKCCGRGPAAATGASMV